MSSGNEVMLLEDDEWKVRINVDPSKYDFEIIKTEDSRIVIVKPKAKEGEKMKNVGKKSATKKK